MRPQRVLHRHHARADGRPRRHLRAQDLGQEVLHRRGRLQLRPDHREVDDEVRPRRRRQRGADRLLPAGRDQLLLGDQPHPAGEPGFRAVRPGRRQPLRVLPPVGRGRDEAQDPDGLDRLRPRRRTDHDGRVHHERHRHQLRLVQRRRHAGQRRVRQGDAGQVRHRRDRPGRARFGDLRGHHAVGGGREEGRLRRAIEGDRGA